MVLEASSTLFLLFEVVLEVVVLGSSVHLSGATSASTGSAEDVLYMASLVISRNLIGKLLLLNPPMEQRNDCSQLLHCSSEFLLASSRMWVSQTLRITFGPTFICGVSKCLSACWIEIITSCCHFLAVFVVEKQLGFCCKQFLAFRGYCIILPCLLKENRTCSSDGLCTFRPATLFRSLYAETSSKSVV